MCPPRWAHDRTANVRATCIAFGKILPPRWWFSGHAVFVEGFYQNRRCFLECKESKLGISTENGISPCVLLNLSMHPWEGRNGKRGGLWHEHNGTEQSQ